MERTSPAAEAVDHIRFQISLLRLCSVPDLATSVQPENLPVAGEAVAGEAVAAESPQTRELEFMTEVSR